MNATVGSQRPRRLHSAGVLALCTLAVAGGGVLQAKQQDAAKTTTGLLAAAMDRSVNPGDDFYGYANGTWQRNREFAPDETYVGARPSLVKQRQARIRTIVDDAAAGKIKSDTGLLVGNFYASYLDQATVDATGLNALAPDLAEARAVTSYPALMRLFARAPLLGINAPIGGSAFYDLHAPGWMRYTITPGGLGLGSRAAYMDDGPRATARRAAYRTYVEDMLKLAGQDDPADSAARVIALETRLAATHWPSADANNFVKTANTLSLAELAALTPGMDWPRFLADAGVTGIDKVIVRQPSAMQPLLAAINATDLADWRAWLVFHLVSDNASMLSAPIAERAFTFQKASSGQEAAAPRWQDGVSLVENYFGQAVGKLYVERWFPEANKRIVAAMFANIQAEMRDRIEHAAWMSTSTRAEALRKIDTLVVKIGYPSKWPDYAGLKMSRSDFYGNLRQARGFAWKTRTDLIQRPLDRDLWLTTPQSSGAAANPNLNEITVPAGALEPPYFSARADPAVNYGAIGGVLAHELSHMFDELGRQFDAEGNLRDWWAPADAARFREIAGRVEREYSGFDALPDAKVNGKFTLNENIADISGLTLAQGAYHRSLRGAKALVRDGMTGDQRLFLGWAQMRVGKMREGTLREMLVQDPHAPDVFRVNGVVPNIDAWYAAFGVTPKNKMYLAPEQRAHFW